MVRRAACVVAAVLVALVRAEPPHVVSRDLHIDTIDETSLSQYRPRPPNPPSCTHQNKCLKGCQKEYIINRSMKVNFFQAWNYCASQGQQLATVQNRQEERQLLSLIWKSRAPMDVWLGATDLGQRGRFTWMSNGQPVKYSRWQQGEPNFAGAYEPCVLLYRVRRSDYLWFNDICSRRHFFACELVKANSSNAIPVDWKG